MKQTFKFICCGNVDDGKSTLIGRILLDTGNVKKDQLEDARRASLKNGSDEIELAMLLDGLLSEREQQITIDIAHRYFDYHDIRFHILDCPGHKQYTKNMAIAAAEVDTAIVVIDVTKGIQEQTLNHIRICSLFDLKNICICLTKCDLISDYKNNIKINVLEEEIKQLMTGYSFDYTIIPVSAVTGYNMDKVLNQIDTYAEKSFIYNQNIKEQILHVQAAKLYQGSRYYYGREINGKELIANKKYVLWPNNIPITVTNSIVHGCFQISENVDISSGDCIANCPVNISNRIYHQTIWFDLPTSDMLLKHGTRIVHVVRYTDHVLELDNDIIYNNIDDVKQNGFGIFIDAVTKKTLGCCVFHSNTSVDSVTNDGVKIYFVSSEEELENKRRECCQKTICPPVVLKIDDLKNTFGVDASIKSIFEFGLYLQQQNFNVIVYGDLKVFSCLKDEIRSKIIS